MKRIYNTIAILSIGLFGFGLTGCATPAWDCACTGADVAYQADEDEGEVASQATCESGFEFTFLGNDQTLADAVVSAGETCCDPAGTDCVCSCAEVE
jgi:hypothetical protein